MEAIDEKQYIQQVLDGQTEAFGLLVERYSRQIHLLIIQLVASAEDAEELTQDVFLQAFRNLSKYRGDAAFSTWLYRIAYNTVISFLRKRRLTYQDIDERMIDHVTDEQANDLLCPSDDEERIEALRIAIGKLIPEEQTIITLFYYEDKSVEEIGVVLGMTAVNVRVRLHRTRKKLYVLMTN